MSLQIGGVERDDHAVDDNLEFTRSCEGERRVRVLALDQGRGVEVDLIADGEVRDELVNLSLKFHGFVKYKIINLEVERIAIGALLQVLDQLREPWDRHKGCDQCLAFSEQIRRLTGTLTQSRHCLSYTSQRDVERSLKRG